MILRNDVICYITQINDHALHLFRFELAKIDGPDENNYFYNKLGGGGDLAFGLTDEITEGTYLWRDGSGLGWSHWGGGQPDNAVKIYFI